MYERAAADRLGFWAEQAGHLSWASRSPRCSTGRARRSPSGSSAGKLNVAYNCVDRHVESGHGDQVAIRFEGEPGDRLDITYAQLQVEVVQGRARADGARRAGGRPRRDLPADDPRGRGRDAGVRAARRPALGRVRRVLGRGAAQPDRRRDGEGRHHRRRAEPARVADGAQAGRRRGGRGVPVGRARPRRPAHRAGRRLDRGPRRVVARHRRPPARRAHARGVRQRAPAVHPLHVGHDREAEGHPAHHRRLPDADVVHAPRGVRPQARHRRLLVHRRHRLGHRALATSSTARWRTA